MSSTSASNIPRTSAKKISSSTPPRPRGPTCATSSPPSNRAADPSPTSNKATFPPPPASWPTSSMQLGRPLAWDAAKGQVTGDAEANRLLKRQYRGPWIHPAPSLTWHEQMEAKIVIARKSRFSQRSFHFASFAAFYSFLVLNVQLPRLLPCVAALSSLCSHLGGGKTGRSFVDRGRWRCGGGKTSGAMVGG